MTVKRVNVTVEDDIHEAATAYAEGKGWSFSGMVTKALREMMDRGDSSPSSGPDMPRDEDTRVMVETVIRDYFTSDKSDAYALIERVITSRDTVPEILPEPIPIEVSVKPVKAGNIEITNEFRDRLKKFGPTDIQNASGVNKGSVSTIQRGEQLTTTRKTFEKLEAGISALEAEAAIMACIPSE